MIQDASGAKHVYKPRSQAEECFFEEFGKRISDMVGIELSFPSIQSCVNHSFVPYISQAPCTTMSQVHCFYRRVGLMLLLAYLLRASDLNHENLVAAGDFPILVDMEFIALPNLVSTVPRRTAQVFRELDRSILGTLALPISKRDDCSALGPAIRSKNATG